jgi:shikimate 5-dehydrogenase
MHRVLLVGTGASARSVAYAISRWYPLARVGVYGRSLERATRLAETMSTAQFDLITAPARFGADVVVHATTVGEADDSITIGPEVEVALVAGVRVFDLTNRLSALQSSALARGCIVMSGNVMQRITNSAAGPRPRVGSALNAMTQRIVGPVGVSGKKRCDDISQRVSW